MPNDCHDNTVLKIWTKEKGEKMDIALTCRQGFAARPAYEGISVENVAPGHLEQNPGGER